MTVKYLCSVCKSIVDTESGESASVPFIAQCPKCNTQKQSFCRIKIEGNEALGELKLDDKLLYLPDELFKALY